MVIRNKPKAVVTLVLGIAALLFVLFRIDIPVVGTKVTMDPGEVFILLGAAFTGVPGALIIVAFRSLGSMLHHPDMFGVSTTLAHGLGAVFAALFFGFVRKHSDHPFRQFLLWAGLVILYYYGFVILIFNFVNFFTAREAYLQIFAGETHFWRLYLRIGVQIVPELLFTLFLTSVVLFFLPKKYREE